MRHLPLHRVERFTGPESGGADSNQPLMTSIMLAEALVCLCLRSEDLVVRFGVELVWKWQMLFPV